MITKTVIQSDLTMKLLRVTIVIFLFFFLTKAQNTLTTQHGSLVIQPSTAIIIVVLATLFVVTISIFLYAKFCCRSMSDLLSPRHDLHHLLRSSSSFSGIDKSVIELVPLFTFSFLKGSKEGLECSICLSMFKESEVLRLLPKCKHAFHVDCIDEWLQNHSNCPLCRCKFDSTDFTSYNYTTSLRFNGNQSPPNLMDSPHLELFVKREEDRHGSARLNFGNNFRKLSKLKNKDCLAIEGDMGKKLHKFKHKIIVSDIFHKRRWSDLSSSDLTLLNSEMLNVVSRKRLDSISPKHGFLLNEQLKNIKEDMNRKRIFESKRGTISHTRSVSGSSTFPPSFSNDENTSVSSRLMKSSEKRSMSEITVLTTCKDFCVQSNRMGEPSSSANDSRDEQIRKLWLPIVRRTLQWIAVRENKFEKSNLRIYTSNV